MKSCLKQNKRIKRKAVGYGSGGTCHQGGRPEFNSQDHRVEGENRSHNLLSDPWHAMELVCAGTHTCTAVVKRRGKALIWFLRHSVTEDISKVGVLIETPSIFPGFL